MGSDKVHSKMEEKKQELLQDIIKMSEEDLTKAINRLYESVNLKT